MVSFVARHVVAPASIRRSIRDHKSVSITLREIESTSYYANTPFESRAAPPDNEHVSLLSTRSSHREADCLRSNSPHFRYLYFKPFFFQVVCVNISGLKNYVNSTIELSFDRLEIKIRYYNRYYIFR